jgi:GMP synthase-like glutamine amidotransferase
LTKEDVDRLYVCAVHGDHVSKLPEGAILHGSSLRTHNEIYTIGERVLCF